jgi:hypothetical protein
MDEGIRPINSLLEKMIGEMVDISCTAILSMYSNYKNVSFKDSCIYKVRYFMPDIVAFIITDLFTQDNRKLNILTFEDINKKFADFKYVFTPGYFREYVFIYYNDNKYIVEQRIEEGIK